VKSLYTCLAAALLTMISVGCSSDDKTATTAGSAATACEAYCTKVGTSCAGDGGTGLYADAAECKTTECAGMPTASECQSPIKAYYDCRALNANLCNIAACTTEMSAVPATCSN